MGNWKEPICLTSHSSLHAITLRSLEKHMDLHEGRLTSRQAIQHDWMGCEPGVSHWETSYAGEVEPEMWILYAIIK